MFRPKSLFKGGLITVDKNLDTHPMGLLIFPRSGDIKVLSFGDIYGCAILARSDGI
jgi:hypothetical protein